MQDHGDLVYLDVQKTGSSFVIGFLAASCKLPLRPSRHHARVVGDYNRDAYYFATVRHPLSTYVSLFRYGADGNGGIRKRIGRAGRAALYERGFEPWLAFIFDDRNAHILREDFEQMAGSGLGLVSFRFVSLSIANAMDVLPAARSLGEVRAIYDKHNLARRVIRNEALNEGLHTLALEDVPQWFDADAAVAYLGTGSRVNVSTAPPPTLSSPDLSAELRRREALLFDLFYGDETALR
jgi:hypothetical protein